MANTPHLGITLLEQSQAQKEVTVNEAFYRIDALLNSGAIDKDLATPPGSPAQGDIYIVAASPTGDWAGKAKHVAYFDQIWRFIVPNEGLMLWVKDEDKRYIYDGTNWIVVEALPSTGDMLKSTYDAANIAQQVLGTSATQTVTNKTLNDCDANTQTAGNNSTKIATTAYVDAALGSSSASRVCEGRLTLTTGVPVTTSDVVGASTIYFTPFRGNNISLWNGSVWQSLTFTEISMALSGMTTNRPYDVFAYINAGAVALEKLVWTNDTTRATALTTQNGVLVKSGDATRRYVGTFYATGASTTEDSAANRYVWNYYNRASRLMLAAAELADSWTYTSSTYRQANANTANQLNFVVGVAEDAQVAEVRSSAANTAAGVSMLVGIGLDSTSTNHPNTLDGTQRSQVASGTSYTQTMAVWRGYPSAGRHYLAWLEFSGASGTTTWIGDAGGSKRSSGINGEMRG